MYACGKIEDKKYILNLCLELIRGGSYYFPNPCDGPQDSQVFLQWPLADTEFDMYCNFTAAF
jgi:hypothetical protein